MKKVIYLLLLVNLTSLFAEDEIIRVAYPNWRPYSYTDNNKPVGIELDIFDAVVSEMGYKVELKEYPWKRCLRLLEIGEVDAVISMFYTDERSSYTIYPDEHITISDFVLFSLEENKIEYDGSLKSIQNYRLGSVLGFHYGDEFNNTEFLHKIEVGDSELILNLVINGRLDIGLGDRIVVMNNLYNQYADQTLVFYDPPVKSDKLYVGFSKKNNLELLAEEFSKSLKRFKTSDAYRKIYDMYIH